VSRRGAFSQLGGGKHHVRREDSREMRPIHDRFCTDMTSKGCPVSKVAPDMLPTMSMGMVWSPVAG